MLLEENSEAVFIYYYKRTGVFEGHARMSQVDARVGMIHHGLCIVQKVLPEKNGPRKTRNY